LSNINLYVKKIKKLQ